MGLSLAELVPYLVIAGQLWILLKVFSTFASVQHAIPNLFILNLPLLSSLSSFRRHEWVQGRKCPLMSAHLINMV